MTNPDDQIVVADDKVVNKNKDDFKNNVDELCVRLTRNKSIVDEYGRKANEVIMRGRLIG